MTSINETQDSDLEKPPLFICTINELKAAKWIFNQVAPNSEAQLIDGEELPTEYEKIVERVVLAVHLDLLISKYEAGDNGALLQIIDACLQHNVPVPKKLTLSFHEAVNKWRLDFENLDQAFNVERPNLRKAAEKRKTEMMPLVYQAVKALSRDGLPTDEYLFEQVGERLGLTYATAKKYYYSAKAGYADKGQLLVKTLGNSRLKFQEDPERAEFIRAVLKLPQKS